MRRINRCLNSRLTAICQRTVQLEELSEKLAYYLPPTLQPHCRVGSFTHGCLLIVVSDPVWSTQLRYLLPELRDKLRKEANIHQLTSIKITVATTAEMNVIKRPAPELSSNARAALLATSEQCNYLPLKEALYQLAKKP
jgi:hypothetical protein